MSVGVLMMVAGETAFHALGFTLAMSASFFSGFRWALTQILLLRHPATSNPFATLFFLAPIMFVTLFTIACFSEGPTAVLTGIQILVSAYGIGKALVLLIVPGILAFCMIASEFTLLQRTSVVTLSICGIFKEVVTISAAGIIFHDELSLINISGLLVTIVSIACYNYLKIVKMRQEAREKVKKRDDDIDDPGSFEETVYDADDAVNRPAESNVPADSIPLMRDQDDGLDDRGNVGDGAASGSGVPTKNRDD
jgi:solute carrier family 35 protein C2